MGIQKMPENTRFLLHSPNGLDIIVKLVCDVAMMREVADTHGSFAMRGVSGFLAEYVRY